MTDTPSAALADLHRRLAATIKDLNEAGMDDGEAMYVLGGSVVGLCDKGGAKDWASFKAGLPAADYTRLLRQIEAEGNQTLADGKHKAAYALQALGLSLVASRQGDDALRQGANLLDAVINAAAANYRKQVSLASRKAN